jgi:hypothetical protein
MGLYWSDLNSQKLPPVVDAADLIVFFKLSIKQTEIQNSKFRSLSEATPYHHNVFTFTLFLPEGRAGVAWEPSNKIMLFLFLSPYLQDKVKRNAHASKDECSVNSE